MIFFHNFMIQISSINLPKISCILSTQSLFMHRHISSGLKPEAYEIFWLWKICLSFSIKIECWHQKHCSSSLFGPLTPKGNCTPLQWRHNGRDSISNHQPHDCLLNHLYRRRSKKTSKFRVTGLCAGNSPGTGEFPAQMASYTENVSIWWRHHDKRKLLFNGIVAAPTHD